MAERGAAFVLVPVAGYAGLWVLGTLAFLVYFEAFGVPMNLPYNDMIQRIPAALAVPTVPICSFASFYEVAKVMLTRRAKPLGSRGLLELGAVSVLVTVGLDLLVTVYAEGVDILAYPTNLMYLFAYIVIIPSVLLAGSRARTGQSERRNTFGPPTSPVVEIRRQVLG